MAPTTATPTSATNPSTQNSRTPTFRMTPSCPPPTSQLLAQPKKLRINWTPEIESAMLQGLIQAVRKGLRADSSYKKEGWQMALDGARSQTDYPVSVASEDVMNTYFEANPDAARFRNAPLAYLEEFEELFEGVIATGNLAITVDEALDQIHNGIPIDPKLLEEENITGIPEDSSEEEVVDKDEALPSVE